MKVIAISQNLKMYQLNFECVLNSRLNVNINRNGKRLLE